MRRGTEETVGSDTRCEVGKLFDGLDVLSLGRCDTINCPTDERIMREAMLSIEVRPVGDDWLDVWGDD